MDSTRDSTKRSSISMGSLNPLINKEEDDVDQEDRMHGYKEAGGIR